MIEAGVGHTEYDGNCDRGEGSCSNSIREFFACFDMYSVHKMANMIKRVIVLGMMATVMEGMAVEATEGPHLTIWV